MMNNSRHQFFPSNKRKGRDDSPNVVKKPSTVTTKTLAKPSLHRPAATKPFDQPASSNTNTLLAGYLANEFLTKGTLFGQPWDPAEAVPLSVVSTDHKPSPSQKMGSEPQGKAENEEESYQRYVEVSHLLKSDGAQIPGVFNPIQLIRFLQDDR